MVGGVDEPYDDTEEQKTLREEGDVEDPSEERGGYYGAEGYVEAEEVECVVRTHAES
jgi:hypothetical protein